MATASASSGSGAAGTRRIEIVPFDGKDFGLWKMRAEGMFMAHDLLDVVETDVLEHIKQDEQSVRVSAMASSSKGTNKPDSAAVAAEKEREETKKRCHRAYGILVQCLQDEQLRLMQEVERGDAHGIWRILLATYERKSMATKVQLLERLFALHMQPAESIPAYVARLTEIERKLKAQGETISESILVYVLLRGLPQTYTSIVQLIKMKESLQMQETIELLKNEEERQASTIGSNGQGKSTVAHGMLSAANSTSVRMNSQCFTCGQTGHMKYDCPRNSERKKCDKCRRVGHNAQECYRKGGVAQSNFAGVEFAN